MVAAMQAFTLSGLDDNERLVSTEILEAEAVNDDIRRLTRERLRSFAAVELWRGPDCLIRVTPRQTVQ
jgi:hypothetical protein